MQEKPILWVECNSERILEVV